MGRSFWRSFMGNAPRALALAVVFLCGRAFAEDDKPQAPASEKARAEALKVVVQAWAKTRENLVGICPTCNGSGVQYRGRFVRGECPSCKGKKIYIGPSQWQRLNYDLYTPARRLKMRVEDVKKAREAEDPVAVRLKSWRFDRVELVGANLGRAYVFEGKDTVARESRWVEAVDPSTKKTGWFLFSEETDGPWMESPAVAPAVSRGDVPKGEPLSSEDLLAVRGKVALVETKLSLEDATRETGTLVLTFYNPKATDATALELDTAVSVVPLTTAGFEVMKDAPAVRLVVLARWRDKFGEVRKRPFRTSEIARDTFGKIHFERLAREEALSHFTMASPTYEGEILWWKD
jgi:hypothetical protein